MSKKFARTMDEAFPRGADYGCAIKVYRNRSQVIGDAAYMIVLIICIVGFFLAVMHGLDVLVK